MLPPFARRRCRVFVFSHAFSSTRYVKSQLLYPWSKIHVVNDGDGRKLMEEICKSDQVLPVCNFYPKTMHKFLATDAHRLEEPICGVYGDFCCTFDTAESDIRLLFECGLLTEKSVLAFTYYIARVEGGMQKAKDTIMNKTKNYAKDNGYRLSDFVQYEYDQMFFVCFVSTRVQ